MSIVYPNWVGYKIDNHQFSTSKILIMNVAKFIDYCKTNNLDYKKIILDNL